MWYRMLSVILLTILFLTACEQTGLREVDGFSLDSLGITVHLPITQNLKWVAPNPGDRWSVLGTDLSASIVRLITPQIYIKEDPGQSLETLMPAITENDYTIEETDDGTVYARSQSLTSDYIIFRDFPDYVISLTYIDPSTTIDPIYINDWEKIALEGYLVIVD